MCTHCYTKSRTDEHFLQSQGKRKALHLGSNSSCRLHLRQHYNLYKEKCEANNIPINHWVIPREIWRVMETEKEEAKRGRTTKKKNQQTLDFTSVTGPQEFTRAAVSGRGITLYRTIRFKERIQCIGPSEFTGPRESVNVIPNWEECITGNYWAYYTHRVALGDAVDDAHTKLLHRKCRISTMPVSIGMSENPGNRICAIFLPPQYSDRKSTRLNSSHDD